MKREELLVFLVQQIIARKQERGPLKVAIDGRCASGKSVLASELAAALGTRNVDVLRSSVDAFHHPRERRYRKGEYSAAGYYEDAFDYQAVVEHLLAPINAKTVLLFEGLFLFRRELNDYWDLGILLDIGAVTSLSRALERDTGVIGPAEIVRRKYDLRYEPAWQIYVDEEHPASKADVIVDNRDFSCPRILSGNEGDAIG